MEITDHSKSIEEKIIRLWMLEALDGAKDMAVIEVGLKLALFWKYPRIFRYWVPRAVAGIWIKGRMLVSYERNKFYADYVPWALRELRADKVRVKPDDYSLS